jgi:hypothetical protein
MRQRLAWLSTAPLMLGGLFAGHWLGYRLAIPDAHTRADALAHSGHGYLGSAPLALTTCALVLIAALVFRALAGFRGQPRRAATSPAIVLLSPAAFVVQEHIERLVHSGQMPWTAALQPTFLVGLALQLPFALAALLIAWALDSTAHAVGRALAAAPPRLPAPVLVAHPAYAMAAPRPAGLARGYGERAPPCLRRP